MSKFTARNFELPLGKKTYIMGILNITPDSFSDGGRYFDLDLAIKHIDEMINDGVDIIDIGAMSTRPNSKRIDEDEEISRLVPVFEYLREKSYFEKYPISVDTFNVKTARVSLEYGAAIINDVSGEINNDMLNLIREYNAGYIFMHARGLAENIPDYPLGVVADVDKFFEQAISAADNVGLKRTQICLDPGLGFGKNTAENMQVLNAGKQLKREDIAYLVALSRKRFIGDISKIAEPEKRDEYSIVASLMGGGDMIRVHDVKNAVRIAKIFDDLRYYNG
ncbi:MAG TPA: dihydropteroate synthase [Clostridiales bacterium]|nr:dihydropteroate synthase [Clostridiales bacterium]